MSFLPLPITLQSGAYVLEEVIGRGGFGITYRARDVENERDVAIKECFPTGCERDGLQVVAADFWAHSNFEALQNRLRSQAHKLEAISHSHLAKVYSCFEENGTVYLVMELVEGQTLLDAIEENAISLEEAALWMEKLASAIQALHQNGLLHLDIKPENIILRDDEPVLLDFDLLQPLDDADFTTRPLSLSLLCGTPGYAPIEQYAQTGRLSPATDVHALGATFYHLLTGNAPLSPIDRAAGTPFMSPLEIRGDLPAHWNDAVLGALEVRADERCQDIGSWLESLREPAAPEEDEIDYSPIQLAPQAMIHGTGFHRVVLTTRNPTFPKRCVCCQEKPDRTWLLNSPSGKHELPLCEACQRHQKAVRASGMVTFWGSILSVLLAGAWFGVRS